MNENKTTFHETEYRGSGAELMAQIRRILAHGHTGQLILNCSEGVVCSVVRREKEVPAERPVATEEAPERFSLTR